MQTLLNSCVIKIIHAYVFAIRKQDLSFWMNATLFSDVFTNVHVCKSKVLLAISWSCVCKSKVTLGLLGITYGFLREQCRCFLPFHSSNQNLNRPSVESESYKRRMNHDRSLLLRLYFQHGPLCSAHQRHFYKVAEIAHCQQGFSDKRAWHLKAPLEWSTVRGTSNMDG